MSEDSLLTYYLVGEFGGQHSLHYRCNNGVVHMLMLMLWCIECEAHADEHMMLVHMNI
jgi:hypothetical protein